MAISVIGSGAGGGGGGGKSGCGGEGGDGGWGNEVSPKFSDTSGWYVGTGGGDFIAETVRSGTGGGASDVSFCTGVACFTH